MNNSTLNNMGYKIIFALSLVLISGIAGVLVDADHLLHVFGLCNEGRLIHKEALILSVFFLGYHIACFRYLYRECNKNR